MSEFVETSSNEIAPRIALGDAVATSAPCTLRWAIEAGGLLARACRARPEKLTDDAFEVRCIGSDGRALRELMAWGGKVLATIRRGELDLMFVVGIAAVTEHPESPGTYVVQICLPERLLSSARRGLFRVEISPADVDVFARVWQIEDRIPLRDRCMPSQERICVIHDLSGGGTRLTLSAKHGPPITMKLGDRLRIDLSAGGRTMQFDGRIRNVNPGVTPGETRCGVAFLPHEHELAWRQDDEYLHHVLAELQRRSAFRRATAA